MTDTPSPWTLAARFIVLFIALAACAALAADVYPPWALHRMGLPGTVLLASSMGVALYVMRSLARRIGARWAGLIPIAVTAAALLAGDQSQWGAAVGLMLAYAASALVESGRTSMAARLEIMSLPGNAAAAVALGLHLGVTLAAAGGWPTSGGAGLLAEALLAGLVFGAVSALVAALFSALVVTVLWVWVVSTQRTIRDGIPLGGEWPDDQMVQRHAPGGQ